METLLALTLIVVVLGALVFVGAMVISSAAEKNTEYVIRDDIADIKSPEQIAAADYNRDGNVDILDASAIQRDSASS